jgi:hypothetical protein
MTHKYHKGKYRVRNPEKYLGNSRNVEYRSSWELKMMRYLDEKRHIIGWNSEEIVIPYKSPIDGRYHRYFVDFLVISVDKDGKKKTSLIEVKPEAQTKPPVVKSRKTKKYLTEVQTWGVNSAKWDAAMEYCADRKWTFEIFTEKHLGV